MRSSEHLRLEGIGEVGYNIDSSFNCSAEGTFKYDYCRSHDEVLAAVSCECILGFVSRMTTQQSETCDLALESKDHSDVESRTDVRSVNGEIGKSSATQEPQQPAYKFPEGGSKAWITVVGVWCTSVCSYGYVNSFGYVQNE